MKMSAYWSATHAAEAYANQIAARRQKKDSHEEQTRRNNIMRAFGLKK